MEDFLKILGGFIAGFATSVFAEPLRKSLFKPNVKIYFEQTPDFTSKTPEARKDNDGKESIGEATYVKGKAVNESRFLARACKVYLVNIEKKNPRTGRFELTSYSDSIPLKWASQPPDRIFSPLDLPKNINQYFDIVVLRDCSDQFDPQLYVKPFRDEALFNDTGTFRFTIQLSGDQTVSERILIILEWNGNWKDFKVYQEQC